MSEDGFTLLDGAVLAVMLIAVGRGAFIGMIRESFSIAALGISCIALRYGNPAAATWLSDLTGGEIGTGAAPFLTGAAILLGTVALVSFLGRYLKRGADAAGLGWADRLGGGAVGFAEGALASTLIVMGATLLLGEEHDSIKRSRSVEAVTTLQEYVAMNYADELERLPDVAAPRKR
ncbi:MAG: CvpA family protein [bacterium]|nr:CvpA family protein [bacterium]